MTAPILAQNIAALRRLTGDARSQGKRVGFVPTMGALHRGHLRLIEVAREQTELVVVSVFVNPTQFGPSEDLERYPRTLETDMERAGASGCHVVYAPSVGEMYPAGFSTEISVAAPSQGLCGDARPGHFTGVATVVCKLFHQVGRCRAVFGRKDYQQLKVIEAMVRDLDMPVEVIGVPTIREPDGLALSSRNAYLTEDQRRRALALARGLSEAHALFRNRAPDVRAGELSKVASDPLRSSLDRVEYVELRDPDTLNPLKLDAPVGERALVAMAGWLGQTRLIDNTVLGEDVDPLTR